eukprot:1207677-Amphidinium_carterae.1
MVAASAATVKAPAKLTASQLPCTFRGRRTELHQEGSETGRSPFLHCGAELGDTLHKQLLGELSSKG